MNVQKKIFSVKIKILQAKVDKLCKYDIINIQIKILLADNKGGHSYYDDYEISVCHSSQWIFGGNENCWKSLY